MKPRRFGDEDLVDMKKERSRLISTANFIAQDYENLPQDVIVIDGDDIRKFGYTTLVDVLKTLPGFRTSQPGNAMEGETFLMRGLLGNDYTKILINGIPIKPEAVRAMPIAAQLPIRHAERIEIIMGPSGAAYGSDAMAGVINIVMAEVDRPVFAWADVSIGNNQAYDINLSLGGKVGRGKNILNYQIFASNYSAADQNIYIPDDSIRIAPGSLTPEQWELYRPEPDDSLLPEIEYLGKESRLIGFNLKYRWFELSGMNMYRTQHAAIGTQPLIYSYHDEASYIGENINLVSLKYSDQKVRRFQSTALASAIYYDMLPGSNYYGTQHLLSNGTNYMYARSFDARAEYRGLFKINKTMNLVGGVVGSYSISHAFTNYLDREVRFEEGVFQIPNGLETQYTPSFEDDIVDSASLIGPETYIPVHSTFVGSGFLQYGYLSKSKNLNINFGTRVDFNSWTGSSGEIVFTPRIGVMYRPIEKLKLRAFYGTGHRSPRSYYIYNSYARPLGEFLQEGNVGRVDSPPAFASERLWGAEFGAQYELAEGFRIKGTYFYHKMSNRFLRQIFAVPDSLPLGPPPPGLVGFAFVNSGGSLQTETEPSSYLHSILFEADFQRKIGKLDLGIQASYQYTQGYEEVESEEDLPSTNVTAPGYRFMPRHNGKLRTTFGLYGFTLSISAQMFGQTISEVYRIIDVGGASSVEYSYDPKMYSNVDISLHKELFRQLSVFGAVGNVFESVQSGITSVNVSDSWTFNPQLGRTFKIGLNFKLN